MRPGSGLPGLTMVTRVMLIVAAALFGVQLMAMAAFYTVARPAAGTGPGGTGSIAAQAAALVRLLDAAPDQGARQEILAAAGGAEAGFELVGSMPAASTAKFARPAELLRLKLAAQKLSTDVVVAGPSREDRHLQVWVRLEDGGVLRIRVDEGPTLRVLGMPLGFFVGLVGLFVALAAVLAVQRELRPLRRLAAMVARDSGRAPAVAIPEAGAPEIRVVTREINRMQARNAALIASRTLALAAISHDLRTYLTRLRLRLEMMPEHPQRDRAVTDMDEMEALMEDTIDFIGTSAAARGPAERCDPAPVLAARAERHGLGPERLQLGPDLPEVPLSAQALGRILDNLLENARRYGGGGELSAQRQGDALCLEIADRGPGIPPAERARVLEPFVRLEVSRSRDLGGAGLGLAIVQRLVSEAEGSLELLGREGGGLLVRLTLG
ncbi:ATP-binding protein [Poseidonocella sp. HB161398]|uniref:ATP-binding protein n=1 Tax=Poseidonocella sp. HB161398 TaxID=2320855 RepID=UPI0011091F4A|nr:ATP-binding protein [Poseidonocella sp. HB161398]